MSVIVLFDGTGALGAGGTALPIGTRAGQRTTIAASTAITTNRSDDMNVRPSTPIVSKVLLKPLVLAGEVTASVVVQTEATSLGFRMGRFDLRPDMPGVSGQTYIVIVREANGNGVLLTRDTTFDIVY